MLYKKVELGKSVNYETLERALIKSAKEVGWRAEVEDKYENFYKLGSVEEVQRYQNKEIKLKRERKGLFNRSRSHTMLEVTVYDKPFGSPISLNNFFITTPISFWSASKEDIKKYLEAVSRNLQSS